MDDSDQRDVSLRRMDAEKAWEMAHDFVQGGDDDRVPLSKAIRALRDAFESVKAVVDPAGIGEDDDDG